MSRKNKIEDCQKLAKSRNGECLSDYYRNAHTYLIWRCHTGHEWSATFNTIQQGRWCLLCGKQASAQKQKTPFQDIKNFCLSKNVQCLSVNYVNMKTKMNFRCLVCLFEWETCFDKLRIGHGCWKCSENKRIDTNIQKYGFDNPMKNREIYLKSIKNSNNVFVLKHWFTGEELICKGSYEKKVVEWLNQNKIDFKWQIEFRILEQDKIYTIDLYLPKEDLWVEIKGRKYEYGMKKWEWFREKHPNSELWDCEKLKEMKIL